MIFQFHLGICSASLTTEYAYDENGNMLTDANKGIDVAYNYLNIAEIIETTGTTLDEYQGCCQ